MSSAERTAHNTFASIPLDRCGEHRADPAWLAAQWIDPAARLLGCDGAGCAPIVDGRLHWLRADGAPPSAPANFLGRSGTTPLFALRAPIAHPLAPAAAWMDLRSAARVLPREDAGLFAYARALANWQAATRHCAFCGAPLELIDGGHRARCTACGRLQFPRTDAAIIVIVEHGDACLLGRQAAWRPRQYSTLAGFVEPGEALADAVRREVREETGIEVLDCDFHSSQPWPFPASLMLGFTATAAGRAIRPGDGELESARWFTAAEIACGLRSGELRFPPPLSIAWHLIQHWLRTRAGLELAELDRPG